MLKVRLRSKERQGNQQQKEPNKALEVSENVNTPSTSAARYSKKYRENLRSDPVAWAEHKAAEAERARARRAQRSEAQKERDRELSRARHKRFYEKRKSLQRESDRKETSVKKSNHKVMTRHEKLKKREYNREKKRESRSRMTPQQKRWKTEKDAAHKREKRAALKKKPLTSTPKTKHAGCHDNSGFPSNAAKKVALSRIWKKMPLEPEKFADVVQSLIEGRKSTPKKQSALHLRGIVTRRNLLFSEVGQGLKEIVKGLKQKHDTKSLRDRRLLLKSALIRKKYRQNIISKTLGVRAGFIKSVAIHASEEDDMDTKRKTRKDATCLEVVRNIQEHYRHPNISRVMPCMSRSIKHKERRVMEVTVSKAYEIWKQNVNNDSSVVGLSLFHRLRPDDVLLQSKTKINSCLCEICTDILFKIQAINQWMPLMKRPELKIKDKYELIDLSICPKTGHYGNPKCIARTCSDCGIQLLRKRFDVLSTSQLSKNLHWVKWEIQEYMHNDQKKSKKVPVNRYGKLSDLLEELFSEAHDLANHIFVAHWQQEQFSYLKHAVPKDWVLMVADFAENYTCTAQDEIQSHHWTQQQVTLHPIVCYYNCNHDNIEEDHIAQEALVFISDDLNHDSNAVHHFEHLAIKYLKEVRKLSISNIVEFTDGCASQYKSKGPFADISFGKVDHGAHFERHFFGSRHGKGPSDGISGLVKSAVRRAVISRQTIVNTAEDMFSYAQTNLCLGDCKKQQRVFFFVKSGEILRNRDRGVKSSLQGTRTLHGVRCVEPGIVDVRLLSCFCYACCSHDPDQICENTRYVLPWQRRVLKMAKGIPIVQEENTVMAVTASHTTLTIAADLLETHTPIASSNDSNLQDIWDSLTGKCDTVESAEDLEDPDISDILTSSLIDKCESFDESGLSLPSLTSILQVLESPERDHKCMDSSGDQKYKIGQFVRVAIPCGRKQKHFVAEITEIKESEVRVNYMVHVRNNLYTWQEKEESWEHISSIVSLLPPPQLSSESTNRRQLFFFE